MMQVSISDISPINDKYSERASKILKTNVYELSFIELAFLIRENIETRICVQLALKRLKITNLKLPSFYRDSDSENQRELIRELLLIHKWYWDIYQNDFYDLKEFLKPHLSGLNLPEFIKDEFKSYVPRKLTWDNESIEKYGHYMNDSRVGVMCGYNMVISFKNAILNGVTVYYNVNPELIQIKSIGEFEKLIIESINCNQELKEKLQEVENKAEIIQRLINM